MKHKTTLLVITLAASLVVNAYLGYSIYTLNSRCKALDAESKLRMAEFTGLQRDHAQLALDYETLQTSYDALVESNKQTVQLATEPFNSADVPAITFDDEEAVTPPVQDDKPNVAVPKPPVIKPSNPTKPNDNTTDSSVDSNGNPKKPDGWVDYEIDGNPGGGGFENPECIDDKDLSKEDTGSGGYQ